MEQINIGEETSGSKVGRSRKAAEQNCRLPQEKENKLPEIKDKQKQLEVEKEELQVSLEKLSSEMKHLISKLEKEEETAKLENLQRLQKELQLTEVEKKMKLQAELNNKLELEKKEQLFSLEQLIEDKNQTVRTLQFQLEEERQRYSQLYKDKSSLEKQMKELAVKLSVGDLHNVLIAVADLQPQWEELGLSLGISVEDLEEIAGVHSSVCRCLYEVLRQWITRIGGSWESLVVTLNSSRVCREDVAQRITKEYITARGGNYSQKNFIVIKECEECIDEVADESLVEIFQSVDWRVLGLLLGLADDTLEKIQTESSSPQQRHKSMIQHWISSGQSYWSTLVEVLKGPVLGKTELANALAQKHLMSTRSGTEPTPVADEVVIDDSDIKQIHSEISHALSSFAEEFKTQPKGMIYIFGVSGASGTSVDVDNVFNTFRKEFKFAAMRHENLTCSHLATRIKAAATFDYPLFCKYKGFYFAGHGGIDQNEQPYFNAVSEGDEVISVQKNILTFFKDAGYKPSDSFMFFFDCCLKSTDKITPDKKQFRLETPVRCLVAFATSPGLASVGNNEEGGRWTSRFCQELVKLEKGETLTSVLDRTHDVVTKCSAGSQPPQYSTCVGPIYLRGPPVSKLKQSQKSFAQCRNELISCLSSDDDILVSLSSIFYSDNVINKNVRAKIRQTKGKEGATTLVDNLEQAIRKKPEILPKLLDKMDEEESLHTVVVKMRGTKKSTEDEVLTDLYKALDQSVKKTKQLENEHEKLKGKLQQVEEEKKQREEQLKKEKKDAIIKIQVLCSELQR